MTPEPLPPDDPLMRLEAEGKATLTPHSANSAVEVRRAIVKLSVQNILAGLRGEAMPMEVS